MINIYTFQFNNPQFLEWQFKTFKHFLKEDHQLICINNSFDKPAEKEAIRAKAQELGIPHYMPEGVDHNAGAGRSHQTAINWAWKNLMVHDESLIILDHDMFPIRNFQLFPEFDVISVMQGRGENIKYFHPGIMIIHPSLKDRQQVDFIGEKIDGLDCDSGGNWWHYIRSHPDLKIKGLSMVNVCNEHENMDVLPVEAREGYYEGDCMQICEDFLLHGRGGSNWQQTPEDLFNRKNQQIEQTINYYMNL